MRRSHTALPARMLFWLTTEDLAVKIEVLSIQIVRKHHGRKSAHQVPLQIDLDRVEIGGIQQRIQALEEFRISHVQIAYRRSTYICEEFLPVNCGRKLLKIRDRGDVIHI